MSTSSIPAHGWVKQVSKKTGLPYWFNTRTGASVWEEPAECRASASNSSSTSTPHSSAPAPLPPRPVHPVTDYRAFELANRSVLAAGESVPHYRDAAEAIIRALKAGHDHDPRTVLLAGGLPAPGLHRFPPTDNRVLRLIVYEVAEDYGLHSENFGTEEGRHVVVWRDGCAPPEVMAAEEEERRLTAEAEARKKAEVEGEAAAAAQRAKDLLQRSVAGGGKRGGGGGGGGAAGGDGVGTTVLSASGAVDLGDDVVEVRALFQKKDKRSIAEIQQELKAKRQRTMGAAAEGAGGGGGEKES
jgi:hypothetical protein